MLHELKVSVTKSRPTGDGNESLTKIVRGSSVQFKQRQIVKTQEERGRWGERIRKGKEDKQEMRAKRAKARAERRQREEDGGSDGDNDEAEEITTTIVTEAGEKREYKRVQEPAEEPAVNGDAEPAENVANW